MQNSTSLFYYMLINSTMVGNDTNTTIQPILPEVPIAQEKEEGHSIFALFLLSACLTVVGLYYLFFYIRA